MSERELVAVSDAEHTITVSINRHGEVYIGPDATREHLRWALEEAARQLLAVMDERDRLERIATELFEAHYAVTKENAVMLRELAAIFPGSKWAERAALLSSPAAPAAASPSEAGALNDGGKNG